MTREMMEVLQKNTETDLEVFYEMFPKLPKKDVYDALYRLNVQGYVSFVRSGKSTKCLLSEEGRGLASRLFPVRDGVWKLIIFDIPEKKRKIRDHIRGRIKALGFKKWQTSIWASPYVLSPEIEEELRQLAGKFFVRLIKTTDINFTDDLEELFKK